MKNKFLIVFIAFATLVSCSDKLEFPPEDQLTQDVSFSTEELALGVLAGAYSAAQQDDVLNGTPQLMGEWQSDNVDFVGSFPTFNDIKDYATLADNTSIFAVWDDSYETIGTANLVIRNVPLVDDDGFTQEERANAIAQAKFLRALVYFNISSWWAQPLQVSGGSNLSVPLVLEPFEGTIEYPSRATLNEVHAQIEQDLLEAIPDLDDADRTVATAGAAQALLARLYLYQERWAEAANYADQVIQKAAYSLAVDYTFYDTESSEFIFTLINNADDGQDSGQGFSGLTNPTPEGRGDAPFSDDLIAAFEAEAGDQRYVAAGGLTQMGTDALGAIRTFTTKFDDGITNADNAPVIRITEMYLTRAEANFNDGTNVGDTPLNDINALRTRAGLPDLLAIASVDEILNERRKELCFEGHRRMDLLRNGLNLRRPGMDNEADSAPGQDKIIFPIPVNELDLNPNLVQNSGY